MENHNEFALENTQWPGGALWLARGDNNCSLKETERFTGSPTTVFQSKTKKGPISWLSWGPKQNCCHAFPCVRTVWKGQPGQPEVGGRACVRGNSGWGCSCCIRGRTKNRRKITDFRFSDFFPGSSRRGLGLNPWCHLSSERIRTTVVHRIRCLLLTLEISWF